jgi:hypothetical protein
MKMTLNVSDFRASIAQFGQGVLQTNEQGAIVKGERLGFAWFKSLLQVPETLAANARILEALSDAVYNDPKYAKVTAQADALLGRLANGFPLTGKKISQVLNKLDIGANMLQSSRMPGFKPVQGDVQVEVSPNLAAARKIAGQKFASDMSGNIQAEMAKHLGNDKPHFEKDIVRSGPTITVGGTTMQRYDDMPGKPVPNPDNPVEHNTLQAKLEKETIDNGYNLFAKFVSGRDDAVLSDLPSKDKTKALILASISNQTFEAFGNARALQSIVPRYGDESLDRAFGLGESSTKPQIKFLDIQKNSRGDFVILGKTDSPVTLVMDGQKEPISLDESRSMTRSAYTLTISREEMDRVSALDWNPKDGSAPPQINFSNHDVAGEMHLFREE